METIQEFSNRIDELISSIKKEDIDSQQFISHEYMLLSLHVYTEREKIDRAKLTNSQKLSSKKLYHLYLSIEQVLSLKANTAKPKDMYNQLIKSQQLVHNANTST